MNGFELMAEAYKKLACQDKIEKEVAEKEIRIFEILASCDQDDLCRLVDSSALNDILKGYMKVAVDNTDIDDISKAKVLAQIPWALDQYSAKEVLGLTD